MGSVGHLTGSYDIERGHPMERCEVAGLKGRFVMEDMFREVNLYPAGNLEKRVYTNPVFGGMGTFRGYLPQPDQCICGTNQPGRFSQGRLMGRERMVWQPKKFFRLPLSRWIWK